MKNLKKLFSALLALMLVFSSLSAGMVVLAAETDEPIVGAMPFASFSVGGKTIDLNNFPDGYDLIGYGKTSAQVKWTMNEGWKISSAYYYGGGAKSINITSGGTVRIPKDGSASLYLTAEGDDGVTKWYSVSIYNGKARLLGGTIWMGNKTVYLGWEGFSGSAEVISIKSSKPAVLAVKKGKALGECTMTPKKTGTSKVTVKVRINGDAKTFSATYNVKAYPKPITELKVDGKAVNLGKNKFYAKVKVKKDKTKLQYKIAKGWKVRSCAYYDDAASKAVQVKSGGTVKTPKSKDGSGGAWVFIVLVKGKDYFWYDLYLAR